MPTIHCRTFTLNDAAVADVMAYAEQLRELYCDEADGHLISGPEDLFELLRISKQRHLAVRFRDDGFEPLVVLWHWPAESFGAAFLLERGRLVQVNLMLPGTNTAAEAEVIRRFGITVEGSIHQEVIGDALARPCLLTFQNTQAASEDAGAYLFGMILFAAFAEVCGL